MSELSYLEKLLDGAEVEWLPLGDISEIYGGLTGKTKSDFDGGNAKYISYKSIFGCIDIKQIPADTVKVGEGERQHRVKYGDVLFTGSSEIAEEAGMSSAITIEFDEPVYLNSFSFGVRFNEGINIIPEFSKYLFRTNLMRAELSKTASGVTRFNISKARFRKVLIPIISPNDPEKSLAIQSEIVRILDTFTALTAELTTELTARKKQYNYYRDQLLSFKEGEVEWKTLEHVAYFINGKGHEKHISEDGKYIVVNSKFISTDARTAKFSDSQICPILKGDILLVMSDLPNGKALSKTFIVDEDGKYTLNQRIAGITVKNCKQLLPKFLNYFLNRTPQLLKYDNGVDQTNLRKGQILEVKIPIPALAKQILIVDILDKFDTYTKSIAEGLPCEIALRQQQYEYYRDLLFSFPKPADVAN